MCKAILFFAAKISIQVYKKSDQSDLLLTFISRDPEEIELGKYLVSTLQSTQHAFAPDLKHQFARIMQNQHFFEIDAAFDLNDKNDL